MHYHIHKFVCILWILSLLCCAVSPLDLSKLSSVLQSGSKSSRVTVCCLGLLLFLLVSSQSILGHFSFLLQCVLSCVLLLTLNTTQLSTIEFHHKGSTCSPA